MAKTSLFHDTRAVEPGSDAPLKIRIYHNGKYISLPTSIKIKADQWLNNTIINHPRAKQWNNLLTIRMADITSELLQMEVTGILGSMTHEQLKNRLMICIGHASTETVTFMDVFNEKLSTFDNAGTISIWNNTLNRLTAFCYEKGYNLNSLRFQDMTAEWMQEFDTFLAKTAPKPNARAINHRNIRAVFNYAMKRKKADIPYPFHDYKIKHQETAHIDLSIEQTRKLATYPLTDDHIIKYRDIFLLMIYLRGINAADLFDAKKSQIINGRLEYYRKKTGALCSVKLEPEAKAIIKRYAGKDYIIDVAEKWKDPKNYLRKMDKGLKKIGPVTVGKKGKKTYHGIFQRISSNSARHTWGSLLFDLGYTIDTASDGLTHKHGSRTTNIYVHKRQQKIVDMANRDLIDYISQKGEFANNAKKLAKSAIKLT